MVGNPYAESDNPPHSAEYAPNDNPETPEEPELVEEPSPLEDPTPEDLGA